MGYHTKRNGEKIAAVLKAWKDLRPTKSFAGMTLEEFTRRSNPAWTRATTSTRCKTR